MKSAIPLVLFLLATSQCLAQPHLLPAPASHMVTTKCFNDFKFPTTAECDILNLHPLGDDRFHIAGNHQCRSRCQRYSSPSITVKTIPSNCTACRNPATKMFATGWRKGNATYAQLCIPRGVCIDACGPERPGCVYSGSCGALICASGANSSKSAVVKRVTHAGPGTVFAVDGASTPTKGPTRLPGDNRTVHLCNSTMGFPQATDYCDPTGRTAIVDGRGKWGQCRAVCRRFDRQEWEMVRFVTKCRFCGRPEVGTYISRVVGKAGICVPREKCVEVCGVERPGCVYTGSCLSQMCFSGINSKRPAEIVFDAEGRGKVSVNDTGPPIGTDPPVYEMEAKMEFPSPSPLSSSPSPSPSLSPPPVRTRAVTTTRVVTATQSLSNSPSAPGKARTNSKSFWIWLGPSLAIFAILVVAVVGIVMYVRKRAAAEDEEGDEAEFVVPYYGDSRFPRDDTFSV